MAEEVELKFTIAPDEIPRLAQLPWLKKLARSGGKREKLVSVYYDTPNYKLKDKHISLRVRRIGDKHLQTIKAENGSTPFSRQEWEDEIDGEGPDLAMAKNTPLEPLIDKKLEGQLQPVFETTVERTIVPVPASHGLVELAIDRGRIKAGGHSEHIGEIELELKEGKPEGLTKIAERLTKELPVRYGAMSKAERGYELAMEAPVHAACAEEIVLDENTNSADGFSIIGLSCLRQVSLNEEPIRRGDAEGIHQMRVGLRRLRAAISLFKDLLGDSQTARLKTELEWLTGQLAPARDLDVFVKESVEPFRKSQPRKKELKPLEEILEKKRRAGFDKAKSVVESERYRRIVVKTALWLLGGNWRTADDDLLRTRRERMIAPFAAEIMAQRTKKIVKRIKKLETLNRLRRHKLRIAIKKMRYATEFFATLFPSGRAAARRKAFGKRLKQLQGALGKLNDITVHEHLADTVVHSKTAGKGPKAREVALAIGKITGKELSKIESLTADAVKAGGQLAALPRFWK
jgi:triphosphatase